LQLHGPSPLRVPVPAVVKDLPPPVVTSSSVITHSRLGRLTRIDRRQRMKRKKE